MTGHDELDEQVYQHIKKVPDISTYELARVLGHVGVSGRINKEASERACIRLFLDRRITWRYVTWPARGGKKRVWRVCDEDTEVGK